MVYICLYLPIWLCLGPNDENTWYANGYFSVLLFHIHARVILIHYDDSVKRSEQSMEYVLMGLFDGKKRINTNDRSIIIFIIYGSMYMCSL